MCAGDLNEAFDLYFSTKDSLMAVNPEAKGSGGIMARKYLNSPSFNLTIGFELVS